MSVLSQRFSKGLVWVGVFFSFLHGEVVIFIMVQF